MPATGMTNGPMRRPIVLPHIPAFEPPNFLTPTRFDNVSAPNSKMTNRICILQKPDRHPFKRSNPSVKEKSAKNEECRRNDWIHEPCKSDDEHDDCNNPANHFHCDSPLRISLCFLRMASAIFTAWSPIRSKFDTISTNTIPDCAVQRPSFNRKI